MRIYLGGVSSSISEHGPTENSFAEYLNNKQLLSLDPLHEIAISVCVDYSSEFVKSQSKLPNRSKATALIRMEPKVVHPSNYKRKRLDEFEKIISIGAAQDNGSEGSQINWPQIWPSNAFWLRPSFDRIRRVALINANKISFVKGEMYSLRRRASHSIDEIDTFGRDWDSKFFKRLIQATKQILLAIRFLQPISLGALSKWFTRVPRDMGPVADKLLAASNYQFCLVIENSQDYMSEKLFDALFSGCLPIYVGPPVESYGIPNNLVVQSGPSIHDIRQGIIQAKAVNLEHFREKLNEFLVDPNTKSRWSHLAVYDKILGELL
jgi:hypothetical protein